MWICTDYPAKRSVRLDVNKCFHCAFIWRSVFGYGGGATAAGDRCHFIDAAERSESPVPAEIWGAAWHQGRGQLLSTSCRSVPGAHTLWSAFQIYYYITYSVTVYSFHSWDMLPKKLRIICISCVPEFENWYKKAVWAPEEELDIAMEKTLREVRLPHIYNSASLM